MSPQIIPVGQEMAVAPLPLAQPPLKLAIPPPQFQAPTPPQQQALLELLCHPHRRPTYSVSLPAFNPLRYLFITAKVMCLTISPSSVSPQLALVTWLVWLVLAWVRLTSWNCSSRCRGSSCPTQRCFLRSWRTRWCRT